MVERRVIGKAQIAPQPYELGIGQNQTPFALSLSKGRICLFPSIPKKGQGFDKLSPNGCWEVMRLPYWKFLALHIRQRHREPVTRAGRLIDNPATSRKRNRETVFHALIGKSGITDPKLTAIAFMNVGRS